MVDLSRPMFGNKGWKPEDWATAVGGITAIALGAPMVAGAFPAAAPVVGEATTTGAATTAAAPGPLSGFASNLGDVSSIASSARNIRGKQEEGASPSFLKTEETPEGITGFSMENYLPQYANGGIPNQGKPAIIVDQQTGRPTGTMNEEGPETIIPAQVSQFTEAAGLGAINPKSGAGNFGSGYREKSFLGLGDLGETLRTVAKVASLYNDVRRADVGLGESTGTKVLNWMDKQDALALQDKMSSRKTARSGGVSSIEANQYADDKRRLFEGATRTDPITGKIKQVGGIYNAKTVDELLNEIPNVDIAIKRAARMAEQDDVYQNEAEGLKSDILTRAEELYRSNPNTTNAKALQKVQQRLGIKKAIDTKDAPAGDKAEKLYSQIRTRPFFNEDRFKKKYEEYVANNNLSKGADTWAKFLETQQ